jgi:two-component system chemotaxis response regulator CheB
MTEKKQSIEATCPECRGPLSEIRIENENPEYRCLVGHRYSARSLLEEHAEAQERVLWSAVVALEESTSLVNAVGAQFAPEVADRLRKQAALKHQQAAEIRRVLEGLERFAIG